MKKIEIIQNSQTVRPFDIPDDEFLGVLPGMVCGWSFEMVNRSDERYEAGRVDYFSVHYFAGMPEDEEEFYAEWARDLGWELTGRVVFRGYGFEYYDCEDRDWYVKDATAEDVNAALACMKEA